MYGVNGSTWKNIEHVKGPLYISGQNSNWDDTYPWNTYEDITLTNIASTFDIYVYGYHTSAKQVSFYNTISNRAGGLNMKIYNQNTTDYTYVPFYYKFKLKVVEENGTEIPNAEVNVTDNLGTVQSWTTDANGEVDDWVKSFEFKSHLAGVVQTNVPDFLYYPFNMTITKTNSATYNINGFNITEPTDWTHVLESRDWDYSQNLAWKILNITDTTILKLSSDGNLAIAGNLYENTNTAPPNVIYKIANILWLTQQGDLYLSNKLMELII